MTPSARGKVRAAPAATPALPGSGSPPPRPQTLPAGETLSSPIPSLRFPGRALPGHDAAAREAPAGSRSPPKRPPPGSGRPLQPEGVGALTAKLPSRSSPIPGRSMFRSCPRFKVTYNAHASRDIISWGHTPSRAERKVRCSLGHRASDVRALRTARGLRAEARDSGSPSVCPAT